METVPIIGGTGALGLGLALRLARAGVPVAIGSRDAGRAADAAGKVRELVPEAQVEGFENAEAATRGPLVLLCVPYAAQADNLAVLAGVMSAGQVLVDATVPLVPAESGRGVRLAEDVCAGEEARAALPEAVEVVSALHSVSAARLAELDQDLDEDALVVGDSREAKTRVAELLARVRGLRPVDCGPLRNARLVESTTPLLISVNRRYKTHAGVRITGLPEDLW